MLALFTTAQKEGVKVFVPFLPLKSDFWITKCFLQFSPLLLGLVEQLQSLIHLTDEGRR